MMLIRFLIFLIATQVLGQLLLLGSEALHYDNLTIEEVAGANFTRGDAFRFMAINIFAMVIGALGVIIALPTIILEIATGVDLTPFQ